MTKPLVIIESAGKIGSYKKALGTDYDIVASFGHCVDLPAKKLSVNIKKDFEPTFEVNPDKIKVVSSLRKMAKKASAIYLMTDSDREGEAISWHLKRVLEPSTKAPFYRAATNEVTKTGIKNAIDDPGDIDMQVVDAYLCRRILDRIVGYKTSFLTQQATGGRSAGRVQSAMLRIMSEREQEIMHFVPEEYWVLTAYLHSSQKEPYVAVLTEKVKVPNEEEAVNIYKKVTKGQPVIKSVQDTEASLSPYAPFTTSTLIQASSTLFGWTASKTMKVAQGLYEEGHISYMRTDSPSMAQEAIDDVRGLVTHEFGDKYLHSSIRKYSAKKGAQEGHECCRPTNFALHNTGSGDARKMYEMIWKRAVASQMSTGKDRRLKVVTEIGGYDFVSRGNIHVFDGFRKCWNYTKKEDTLLPNLKEGEQSTLLELKKEQKWTTPPPRYSDASLQKKCETAQIARPATFASFLKTLEDRGYIKRVKKSFHATELGMKVVDFLVAAKMCFVDLDFTAEMELMLDKIASGKMEKLSVLTEFWDKLKANIENGKKVKSQQELTDFDCPSCPGKLRRKFSRFGPFFSCENYKKDESGCKFTAKVSDDGKPLEKVKKEKEYLHFVCEYCGSKMVKRKSRYGEFGGCNSFPNCRGVSDLDGTFQPLKKGKDKGKYKKSKKGKKKNDKPT